MLHRTAKLTPFGRRLLVDRVLIEGWPAATAAEMLGVSRATAYKWLRRYRAEGRAGLEDRSARPLHRPRACPIARSAGSWSRDDGCGSGRIASVRCSAIPARPCTASCAGTV
jgi:hypothetical protein